MKMEEEIRNGVRIRKHYKTSTKISEDGLIVEKEFIDKADGGKLKNTTQKSMSVLKVLDISRTNNMAGFIFKIW